MKAWPEIYQQIWNYKMDKFKDWYKIQDKIHINIIEQVRHPIEDGNSIKWQVETGVSINIFKTG